MRFIFRKRIRFSYHNVLAHMHEVTKDDFGLGQKEHDGMYKYMTAAFGAAAWVDDQYKVTACNEFSDFLYDVGVSKHKSELSLSNTGSLLWMP